MVIQGRHRIHTILSNDNPRDLLQIDQSVDQAINLAAKLKETRDRTKKESIESFIQKIDRFFNPPKDNQS